ncbi:MAG: bifunctional YncE family protein/alkaline phosphatase family protein [Verrucomicrobia bacterium]|nr:bifunctional YncE family protein/alkaline phosphatase family protein [Verrucomicrobiota bacterium]
MIHMPPVRRTRLMALALLLLPGCALRHPPIEPDHATVGRLGPNLHLTPTSQLLTPAGRQIELPAMRPQALALSPDGRLLITAGRSNRVYVIDAHTAQILQRQSMPRSAPPPEAKPAAASNTRAQPDDDSDKDSSPFDDAVEMPEPDPDRRAWASLTGIVFSPDGTRLYMANAVGDVKVFAVTAGRKVTGLGSIAVPQARAAKRRAEIPTGLAVSADGRRLYVAGNLGNRLYEIDAAEGKVLRRWDVGVAPFDVVVTGGKAYVSNQGGRRPGSEDLSAPAGKGKIVRVDPVRHIASEGSLTVIDLEAGEVKAELIVGLHASALAVTPDGRHVVVANTGSDTLSVIDTTTDQVVEKIWTRQTPADLFGAQPNALAFDRQGRRLFVCNGTQNAVAVVHFEPAANVSRVLGFIPVGWFPGAVAFDAARERIWVANIKGIGVAREFKPEDPVKLRSKDFHGTLSLVPVPSPRQLAAMTAVALRNMRHPRLQEALLPPRPGQPPRPVPERVGEPSVFRHVIYVIKENRTYDQVLGDMAEGDGDPSLCTFGETYTPNQHKIAREFVLLDNTYCSGVQSADGHQWTDSAIANAYMERQLSSDFPRSYPSGKGADGLDALAWSSSGFIWDNALAHGKTFRNYGEWMISEAGWTDKTRKSRPSWLDFWKDHTNHAGLTRLSAHAGIKSLEPHSLTRYVGYDLRVPDVRRAAAFIDDLKRCEAQGEFPNLAMVFLPNNHTGGAKERYPTPGAQIADNDLALGRIVEAVSHSRFWPETCLLVIEDDPQAGWDHVSGYRTTCFVVSPYTKRRQTVHTAYNQTSLIRTLELILGLPPMNQLDATATPMSDCFTLAPDFTPFTAVPNQVPLDQINPPPRQITDPILRRDAVVSARLPLDEVDRCPEDVFNRILWRAMKGPRTPYPEWAVKHAADDD